LLKISILTINQPRGIEMDNKEIKCPKCTTGGGPCYCGKQPLENAEILEFTKPKLVDFPEQQELYERLISLVYEYDGISLAAVVGVLDLVKDQIKSN